MRKTTRIGKAAVLLLITMSAGGCVDAFVEGLSRGFADGVAFIVEDFITQLPGQSIEK